MAFRSFALIFLTTFCLGSSGTSFAATPTPNSKPLTARVLKLEAQKGHTATAVIELQLQHPYHAYQDQFKIDVSSPVGLILQSFSVTPIVSFFDTFSKKERMGFKGSGQMLVQLAVSDQIPTGQTKANFLLTYQACTDEHCLFPTKMDLPFELSIQDGSSLSQAPSANASASSSPGLVSFDAAVQKGLLYTFLFVFLAGILTSFTPCIFPMIPITLSIIGASQIRHLPGSETAIRKRSRWRGFSLSVVYVLGIALTYALLGVFAAKTGALFGSTLANPYVVIFIAAIFVAMGLSMYGLFEIQMPGYVRDRLSKTKTDPGFAGAFVAGLIAGVVASPCVGPVLVGLLTHVAKTQDMVLGFALLFVFAVGMGLLLIAIGTFSSLASKLPRSGGWMDAVKFIFGTAMIGMALFYVRPLASESAFYILFGFCAIAITSAFGAFEPNQNLTTNLDKMRKGLMLAGFALGILYFLKGFLYPNPFLLPSALAPSKAETKADLWREFSEDEFRQALKAGTPIVIDFWAEWCSACKELNKFTFSDLAVQKNLGEFKAFKVDMTVDNAQTSVFRERFKIMGLPTILFFKDGKPRSDMTLTGFESAGDFNTRLTDILQNR